MEEERQEPVKTTPTPITSTNRSSDEDSDVEESEHPQLDEEQKNSDTTARIHVCEHCGKQFSSGKALGGHKRIHSQFSKRDPARKKKNCRKIRDGADVIHGCSCSICGKIFGSVNALYGHLRLHPDRPWRGVVNNQNQSSSPLRYDQSNHSRSIEPKLRDLDSVNLPNDTAKILLLLACENQPNKENPKKRKLFHGNGGDHEIRVCSSKEKKKVYICYPCNKSFNSHQAYGGHVSSHNKSGSKTGNESRSDPPSRSRVLDFDLNELPPPEDDDDQFRSQ